jgi:hypothetical protein
MKREVYREILEEIIGVKKGTCGLGDLFLNWGKTF